jgi:DNA gyrase subunit A
VTERGWAKRVSLDELAAQGRGGLGTPLIATSKETGEIAAAREVHPGEDLMAVTSGGRTVRVKPDAAPLSGRTGAAEKSVAITGNERIAAVTHVAERELPESPGDDEPPDTAAPSDDEGGVAIEDAAPPPPSTDESAPPDDDPPGSAPPGGELDLFA